MSRRREAALCAIAAALCVAWEPLWRTQPDVDDGIEAYRSKQWAEALAAFDRAGQEIPDTPELHLNRGDVLYQQAQAAPPAARWTLLAKAREEFQRALALDPAEKKAAAYHNLGTTVTRLAMLNERLEKDRPVPQSREDRIALLQTAIDAYKKALDLESTDVDTKFNLEVAQRLLRQLEEEKKKEEEQKKKQEQQQKKNDQKKNEQKPDQKKPDQKQDARPDPSQNQNQNQKQDRQQDPQKQEKPEAREKKEQKPETAKGEPPKPRPRQPQQAKEQPLDLAPLEALKNTEKPLQLYRIMMDPRQARVRVKKDW